MVKEIRSQIYRMTFVLAMLLALGVWKFDFIIEAVSANLFLNLSIFGTFAFGTYVAYRNVLGLSNECVAYFALREDYDDTRNSNDQDAANPSWCYSRCNEDAIVFAKPKILEQPFQIISEEIARTNNLSMSTGVMQNLLDSIDDRLDEGRSLIQYVTGVLIFLGLIGTFVGLMLTLASVGAIIGGLDLSGGAGAAAIQKLMDGLKVPLQGMATGFSSSLFGLVTSLALGVMARFANQASGILKTEFENWIAGVAKVDSEVGGGAAFASADTERQLSLMYRVARLALVSNTRIASTVEKISEETAQLRESQIEANSTMKDFASSLGQMTHSQVLTNKTLVQINETMETRAELAGLMDDLKVDTANQKATNKGISLSLENLSARQSKLQDEVLENQKHIVQRDELKWLISDTQNGLNNEFRQLNLTVENLGGFLTEINANLDTNTSDIRFTQNKIYEESQDLNEKLSTAIAASKTAISEADKRELDQADQSIMGIRSRLFGSYPTQSELPNKGEENSAKSKWKLNPFRRSA